MQSCGEVLQAHISLRITFSLNAGLGVQVHGVQMAQEGSRKGIGLLEVHKSVLRLIADAVRALSSYWWPFL